MSSTADDVGAFASSLTNILFSRNELQAAVNRHEGRNDLFLSDVRSLLSIFRSLGTPLAGLEPLLLKECAALLGVMTNRAESKQHLRMIEETIKLLRSVGSVNARKAEAFFEFGKRLETRMEKSWVVLRDVSPDGDGGIWCSGVNTVKTISSSMATWWREKSLQQWPKTCSVLDCALRCEHGAHMFNLPYDFLAFVAYEKRVSSAVTREKLFVEFRALHPAGRMWIVPTCKFHNQKESAKKPKGHARRLKNDAIGVLAPENIGSINYAEQYFLNTGGFLSQHFPDRVAKEDRIADFRKLEEILDDDRKQK